ncbi:MAG: penicillin-binding protein 1C [Candidatus Poribacteria bacterium]|nr:penicillin-binding protein 1C [Candidatus Poribacteria bacterium]
MKLTNFNFFHFRTSLLIKIGKILRKRGYILAFCLMPFCLFALANWFFPLPKEKLQPLPSTVVMDRNGEWLRAFTSSDDMWRLPETSLDAISPRFQTAMLTYEDQWFYHHWGINPVSLVSATVDNLKAGRVVRGGSTITMQLARLMEPKDRTLPNKFIEMFRSLQLELTYTKSEILTFYFNMLPYGGNIVGSGAAARLYFNKPQSALSFGEAALLAAIPNSPERLRLDRFPERARKARKKVLLRMRDAGKISEQQMQEALQEPIPTKRYPLPFKAPHLSRLLTSKQSSFTSQNVGNQWIRTTIDQHYQDTATRILRERLRPLQGQGVSTGAVVVLDTKSREVLAMVGSHDFFYKASAGQVNGTLALRSPGSTLKPFIYALAIDKGLITPQTLLFDVPIDYAGYTPINYDEKFTGYVTAREALARSLNVPAVNLYAEMGNNHLYGFLKQAGISTLSNQEEYGLSLVLGGCGINLLELTNLYAGLANMGEFAPYKLIVDSNTVNEKSKEASVSRLLRPETSWIVTEMLTTLKRPDFPKSFEHTGTMPKVAWKTGTSYGHRDAWSIGYSPELTIGVWIGNFDGTGAPILSGSEAAAPILFALFTALSGEKAHQWFIEPANLKIRLVCALTGLPLSPHCLTSTSDVYIPGVSSVRECHIHKNIQVDIATGERLCSSCRPGRQFRKETITVWPAEVATWLNANGFAVPQLPPHNADCTRLLAGTQPIILSPARGTVYHIRSNVPVEYQKIRLSASVSGDTQEIFWFLNGELIFKGKAVDPTFLTPVAGKHELTCIDGAGRSTSLPLTITQ